MSRIAESFPFYPLWPAFGKCEELKDGVGKTGKGSIFCVNVGNFSQISKPKNILCCLFFCTNTFLSFDKIAQNFFHFCVFEDFKVLPFCPKVEDLSRHPSIFKPHEDFGAWPKGFGKNVKMCVFLGVFVFLWVCICALHIHLCLIAQVTNHCYVFHTFKVQQLLPG